MKTFDIRDLRNHGDNVKVKKESDTHWLQTLFFLLRNKRIFSFKEQCTCGWHMIREFTQPATATATYFILKWNLDITNLILYNGVFGITNGFLDSSHSKIC